MKTSPIDESFVQALWADLLERQPSMATVQPGVRMSIKLGFLYGVGIATELMVGVSKTFSPAILEAGRDMIKTEISQLLKDLKVEAVAAKRDGERQSGAAPDITGIPIDREFKL